jgi:glycosyltransferase involved in cell wall biosynthesis
MPKKILIISNTAWYIFNFRLSLMKALKEKGNSIVAVAPADEYVERIKEQGFTFIPLAINRKGINPFEDIILVYRFYRMFKQLGTDLIMTYTPKPNIYASVAAAFLTIPVINNVSGLGNVFINPGIITIITKHLYKFALRSSLKVFFQNNDDLALFSDNGLVRKSIAERIPGSGVDIHKFVPSKNDNAKDKFIFMLVARLLWDKGIGEFVEAARLLREKYPNVVYRLVGFLDPDNPQGISSHQIKIWVDEEVVSYAGSSDNIVEIMGHAQCIVLPSYYREGVPKVLLEAASMAKPIVTTDAVGCRDAVEDGVTGFLCKVRDAKDLADKMERVLLLTPAERERMGLRGREKMIHEFDERIVIQRYVEVIDTI